MDTYREILVEAHQKSSEAYDKAVMTLAGGALAISITFVHDIAPNPRHEDWLAASWVLLAVSLLLIFASFLASQHAILREIKLRDNEKVFRWNIPGMMTSVLNIAAGLAFISGIACMVWFAWLNI